MAAIQQPAAVDTDKLMGFVFRAVDEVGSGYDLVTMLDCLHDMGPGRRR
jgi:hypothetical protein